MFIHRCVTAAAHPPLLGLRLVVGVEMMVNLLVREASRINWVV